MSLKSLIETANGAPAPHEIARLSLTVTVVAERATKPPG